MPGDRAALIREASRLFCAEPRAAAQVEQALLHRESMGETYIPPLQAVLLHSFTPAVPGCRLGYLKAEPPVYEKGRALQGALEAVSAILIEQPALMPLLRRGSRDEAAALLEKELGERFRQALSLRIGR